MNNYFSLQYDPLTLPFITSHISAAVEKCSLTHHTPKRKYNCKFYSPQFVKKRTILQKARKSTSLPASPYKVTARRCLLKSFKGLPTFTIRPKSPSKTICYIIVHNFLVNSRLMCIVCPQLFPTTLKLENKFCIQRVFIASLSLYLLSIVSDRLLLDRKRRSVDRRRFSGVTTAHTQTVATRHSLRVSSIQATRDFRMSNVNTLEKGNDSSLQFLFMSLCVCLM